MNVVLDWWTHHLARWNGKSLLLRKLDLACESDASITEWGATSQCLRTGGPWSPTKRTWHINSMELVPATLGVKNIPQEPGRQTYLVVPGQHDRSRMHQQPKGNSFTSST